MLSDEQIVTLVARMLERTRRPPLANPIHHLVRDGLRPVDRPLRGTGHETTDGTTIWYRWTSDERELGRRVKHGHSHALLLGEDHNETDAILVTAELVLPAAVARRYATAGEAMRDVRFAPSWLVELQFDRKRPVDEEFYLVS